MKHAFLETHRFSRKILQMKAGQNKNVMCRFEFSCFFSRIFVVLELCGFKQYTKEQRPLQLHLKMAPDIFLTDADVNTEQGWYNVRAMQCNKFDARIV